MAHHEFTWQSADGQKIYAQAWEPKTPSKAVVCLVHGMGEHSGRYQHVANALNEAGFTLLAYDQLGHGKSGGPRGHAPSEDALVNNLDALLQNAVQRYPGKPRFLYGHSLGGLLVLFYTLRRCPDVVAVISSSPLLRTPLSEQKFKVGLSKILAPLLPTVSLASGLDAQNISRDPQVIQRYTADPMIHDRVTFAMATSTLRIMDWTWAHAAEFPTPLLLTHGTADQLTYAQGSQDFGVRVKSPVTIKLWEGLKHETHNEPEQQQVIAYLIAWMDQQLASR